MQVELGDHVFISDIEMTCFEKRENFSGVTYTFVYFQCGELKEIRFAPGELYALGATKASSQGIKAVVNVQPEKECSSKCPRMKSTASGCEFLCYGKCHGIVYATNPPQYDDCVFMKGANS